MNNTYPKGIQPNILWRLTSTLFTIQKSIDSLVSWQETKDKKTWHKYVMSHVGVAFEYAIIVEEQLSKNYLIADRLLEFYHVLYKYWDDNTDTINTKQTLRIYKALYKATLNFWILEIKRLNQTPEHLKQNANKILNESDPYFDPVINLFKTLAETLKT